MNAFTLWTAKALERLELATTSEGRTYGICFFGEIWFRCRAPYLYAHTRPSAEALMERKGS